MGKWSVMTQSQRNYVNRGRENKHDFARGNLCFNRHKFWLGKFISLPNFIFSECGSPQTGALEFLSFVFVTINIIVSVINANNNNNNNNDNNNNNNNNDNNYNKNTFTITVTNTRSFRERPNIYSIVNQAIGKNDDLRKWLWLSW